VLVLVLLTFLIVLVRRRHIIKVSVSEQLLTLNYYITQIVGTCMNSEILNMCQETDRFIFKTEILQLLLTFLIVLLSLFASEHAYSATIQHLIGECSTELLYCINSESLNMCQETNRFIFKNRTIYCAQSLSGDI
jgi:hypothetical protein